MRYAFYRRTMTVLCGTVLVIVGMAGPAQADYKPSIGDVMSLIYCVVGLEPCQGVQPGADAYEPLGCGEGTELGPNGAQCVLPGGVDEVPNTSPESWEATISDVMDLVYCLVGVESCAGLEPGLDTLLPVTCGAGTVMDGTGTMCVVADTPEEVCPSCPGAPYPGWELQDLQPGPVASPNPMLGQTYGLDHYYNPEVTPRVTVVVLLAGY